MMRYRNRQKSFVTAAATMGLVILQSLTAYAAPETMPDGTIFDAEYYAANNPDVAAVVGTDTGALYQHYLLYGKGEGRQPYAQNGGENTGNGNIVLTAAQKAAMAPAFNAPATKENALRLTQIYDQDGYYILTNAKDSSIDFWLRTGDSLSDALDTCVHETFHFYVFNNGGFGRGGYTEAIYIGDGQTIQVPETKVFKTQEWAQSLSAELRTFRYDTYVSSGATASSNQDGVYGLLNEFAAYGWGLNNQVALYDYYAEQPFSRDIWAGYVSGCENNYTAFCEFRFYILGYLDYAYKVHPDIWKQIMNNQDFVNAYCVTERRFENNIARYLASQQLIVALGRSSGHNVRFEGSRVYIDNYGCDVGSTGRDRLSERINSSDYQVQEQYLFSKCSIPIMGVY